MLLRLPGERAPRPIRRAAAEGLGVFALVLARCGAIIAEAEHPGTLGTVGVALVFGLIVMAMVYATGHLSGAHLNPAVTLAFAATRHFPRTEALAYLLAQLLGAVLAAGLLAAIWLSDPAHLGATIPTRTQGPAGRGGAGDAGRDRAADRGARCGALGRYCVSR